MTISGRLDDGQSIFSMNYGNGPVSNLHYFTHLDDTECSSNVIQSNAQPRHPAQFKS